MKNLDLNNVLLTHRKGVIESKLDILQSLMNISHDCKDIGFLDEQIGININSDALMNTSEMAVMSFVNVGDLYVPNSILKRDLREISNDTTRNNILATIIYPANFQTNKSEIGMINEKAIERLSKQGQRLLEEEI